jgi:hypothetical protein
LPQDELQHWTALESSVCAVDGADVMQLFSHVLLPLQPWMHVMMPMHPSSPAQAWVVEQHCDVTQFAHAGLVNATPQAAVMPPAPPPALALPPLLPLPPPLDSPLPLADSHTLAQLWPTQLFTICADDKHDGFAVTLDRQLWDVWADALYAPFGQ